MPCQTATKPLVVLSGKIRKHKHWVCLPHKCHPRGSLSLCAARRCRWPSRASTGPRATSLLLPRSRAAQILRIRPTITSFIGYFDGEEGLLVYSYSNVIYFIRMFYNCTWTGARALVKFGKGIAITRYRQKKTNLSFSYVEDQRHNVKDHTIY